MGMRNIIEYYTLFPTRGQPPKMNLLTPCLSRTPVVGTKAAALGAGEGPSRNPPAGRPRELRRLMNLLRQRAAKTGIYVKYPTAFLRLRPEEVSRIPKDTRLPHLAVGADTTGSSPKTVFLQGGVTSVP